MNIPIALRRRAATALRNAGWKARHLLVVFGEAIVTLPEGLQKGFCRLSDAVAGCGCTDDDPEICGEEWCECPCHGPLPGESNEDFQRRDGRTR